MTRERHIEQDEIKSHFIHQSDCGLNRSRDLYCGPLGQVLEAGDNSIVLERIILNEKNGCRQPTHLRKSNATTHLKRTNRPLYDISMLWISLISVDILKSFFKPLRPSTTIAS